MDIKHLDWNISKQDLQACLKDMVCGLNYVYGQCFFWEKECFATFLFSELDKHIKKIEISFDKTAGPGTEATDFKRIFNILKGIFGEPNRYINIDPIHLEQLKSVYTELRYDKLPRIVWEIDGKVLVHRFKDYWGMIPNTYIEGKESGNKADKTS